MIPPRPPATTGWLVRQLIAADRNLRAAEQQVQGFLTSLFPDGWMGWSFVEHPGGVVTIDVYQAIEAPAAIDALHRAGFAEVRVHPHESSKFITCMCRVHSAP